MLQGHPVDLTGAKRKPHLEIDRGVVVAGVSRVLMTGAVHDWRLIRLMIQFGGERRHHGSLDLFDIFTFKFITFRTH